MSVKAITRGELFLNWMVYVVGSCHFIRSSEESTSGQDHNITIIVNICAEDSHLGSVAQVIRSHSMQLDVITYPCPICPITIHTSTSFNPLAVYTIILSLFLSIALSFFLFIDLFLYLSLSLISVCERKKKGARENGRYRREEGGRKVRGVNSTLNQIISTFS